MSSLQSLLLLILLLQPPTIQATTPPNQTTPPPKAYILPPTPVPSPARILTTVSNTHAFAGPHLLYNNGTAYEGFYFDTETIPAGALTLSTIGDGSNARAQGGVMEWFAADDLSALVVELNVPEKGVSASITMRARAPLHVPCGVKQEGASYMLTELLGWAPVVAGAEARVEVLVNGTKSVFEGAGYADQIFSLQPLFADLTQWYWGHARVGPYSLVWYYHIDAKHHVSRSFQLAQDGKAVVAACGDRSGTVTPLGGGGGGVPVADPAGITGWVVSVVDERGREYRFEVRNDHVAQDQDLMGAAHDIRWIGRVEGGGLHGPPGRPPTSSERRGISNSTHHHNYNYNSDYFHLQDSPGDLYLNDQFLQPDPNLWPDFAFPDFPAPIPPTDSFHSCDPLSEVTLTDDDFLTLNTLHCQLPPPTETISPPHVATTDSEAPAPDASILNNNALPRLAPATHMPTPVSHTPSSTSSRGTSPKETANRVVKRELNTQAARRYRQRRVDQMSKLEAELEAVKRERDALKMHVSKLEGETDALRGLLELQKQK
ncbi:hypothetical protein P168DRAFT_328989 [Aspergillus campestris IBT 28561]|uniref:BZIP domain-containing protein n=1 Tax=Aspergillus campestris (strain IBT 28561) TaxID=1392248 RepID=A0A2I1CWJ9_ASPC2|nr:uncharacterized protein P168DRAFT_328989 [Aspergillus campestris IBT 28561]PKY01998.1 hypothetical protein P168DRAFT_328989 [Aspergillus campestris IBT 28561]